ncbi:DUF4139 domain-containing protein [Parasediminibacterium sp. JCM 36343]|uniref:DUF4139 domain-containing protein n=1 Tax=Parasediminibacterium sp. JCM 36343 TaxID=3374279 RepID=UPI00397A01E8
MKKLFFCFLMFISLAATAQADKPTVAARLQSVTVYRSGAEMMHTATATLKQGTNELVIGQLSNAIDINSIQIKMPDGVTLLSNEFSNNYLKSSVKSPRVILLEDSIEAIRRIISKTDLSITNDTELLGVLKLNREIKGTQTGMSVAELIKLMDYYKTKASELQTEVAQLQEKKNKMQELINKLNAQLQEEQQKNVATSGVLTLQLLVGETGKYNFGISYIAQNAHWSPIYDLRVDDIKSPLKLVYKAVIDQETGIDWKQVKLALSTATPGQSGQAPVLNAWFLNYTNPVAYMERRMMVNSVASYKSSSETALRADNDAPAMAMQKPLEEYVAVSDNTLNVTFDIDVPYDILTTGKAQTAVLKTYQVAATYKHYAVPKLDRDAYILAEIADWEKLNLLPGEANVILEGTYTGKTFIDPNATQDTLNLTLGKDKRVVIKRDKLVDYSSVKFLGSNKLQRFIYEITIKNNKKEGINLQLKDQFPLSTNKEIEVELVEVSGGSVNNDIGVLNWQLAIPSGESKKVKFTYTVKYPKDKTLNLN